MMPMNQPNTAEPICGNRPGRKQTLLLCLVLALVTAATLAPEAVVQVVLAGAGFASWVTLSVPPLTVVVPP